MARLNGAPPGFVFEPPPLPKTKTKRKAKADRICAGCGYISKTKNHFKSLNSKEFNEKEMWCKGCRLYFNIDQPFGSAPMYPDKALRKLEVLKEKGYLLATKSGKFGTPEGLSVQIDAWDIFKPIRIGSTKKGDNTTKGSMAFFTVDILIGNVPLTLHPWEFGTITWIDLMQFRKEGAYIEQYVSTDDVGGYWAPTKKFRKKLNELFGER